MINTPPLGSGPSSSTLLLPLVPLDVPVEHSSDVWRSDLRALFKHAKDRFGDVVWDVGSSPQIEDSHRIGSLEASDEDESRNGPSTESHTADAQEVMETIWGHKAIIYARAPPAFQYRYFPRTLNRSSTPALRSPSAAFLPTPSTEFHPPLNASSLRVLSQASVRSTSSTYRSNPTHIRVGVTPHMFKAELEWLYTGEGMGDVAEWLNQDTTLHTEPNKDNFPAAQKGLFGLGLGLALEQGAVGVDDIQKIEGRDDEKRESLRNDLVYMWRSKLYSDVKIVLPCESLPTSSGSSTIKRHSFIDSNLSDDSTTSTCAVFSTHKFILASRSPYFASLLLNSSGFRSGDWEETNEIELFSPPFTPASVHFCLGYMYAGTLAFSNRTYDLTTAFEIHRSATYLLMDSLRAEVEARIIHEMCDSLSLSRSPGPTKLCARRVPRVWRFAGASDVGARDLQSRTRTWIVRHWAECWSKEIGDVEARERDDLVNEVIEGMNPQNLCTYLRGVGSVKSRTESELRTTTGLPRGFKQSMWVENLLGMISRIESRAKEMWITQFGDVVRSQEFAELLGGKGFGTDLLEGLMTDVANSANSLKDCKFAGKIYQDLTKAMLSFSRADGNESLLSSGSAVKILIEKTRAELMRHLRRRWIQVREHSGFVDLEPWALQEISDGIDQSVEELLAPPISPFVPPTRAPPVLSSSISRISPGSGSCSRVSDPSHPITKSLPARRLDEASKPTKTPNTVSVSSRLTSHSRAVASPKLATNPAKSTTITPAASRSSSSSRPSSAISSTSRVAPQKTPVSKSASTVSLSGRRSVGGPLVSTNSSAAARSTVSNTPRVLPTTSSRTSTTSSSAPSSTRTRLTTSEKSTPASTPNSSVVLSDCTVTPSIIATSPSITSINSSSGSTLRPKASTSSASVVSSSSKKLIQSTSTNNSVKSRVSATGQLASANSSSRLSSTTSSSTLSKTVTLPRASSNAPQKTPALSSRERLSSTTSSSSVRSLAGSSRTSNVLTPSTTATATIATSGARTRTTTSPSIRSIAPSSTTNITESKPSRQRTHTSPALPTKTATVSATSAPANLTTRSSGASSLGRTSSTPLTHSMKNSTSSSRLSAVSTKQTSLNNRPVVPGKTVTRSESVVQNTRQSLDANPASVTTLGTMKRSASSYSVKRSDSISQTQSKQEIRSPSKSKPRPAEATTPTSSSILPGPTASNQSPSTSSPSSLLSPSFVKRARSHPAASFDPPKRLPLPRKQLALDKFSVHSLATGEVIEPSPGISLHVGIPCVVSIRTMGMGSGMKGKKVRCKAWARYIGSLVGREGAWVGVELAEDLEGTQLQAEEEIGCWKGVKYYEVDRLGLGDEWEIPDGGVAKKRRSVTVGSTRDKNSLRRGMFLAPADVIWVKGA